MGALFKIPKPQTRDPIIDQREGADVGISIDADANRNVQKRIDAARSRTGRGSLQIPRSRNSTGVSIPS